MKANPMRLYVIPVTLSLVIAVTLALFVVNFGPKLPALWNGGPYAVMDNRQPVEATSACMWVDVKGPNGVRALQCIMPSAR